MRASKHSPKRSPNLPKPPRSWLLAASLALVSPVVLAAADGDLVSPTRLAPSPDGRQVVVSDYQARRVAVLRRSDLGLVREIPIDGRPLGVAFWGSWIYVGNESRSRVEVYTRTGRHLFDFELEVAGPTDIAVSGRDVLVAAAQEGRVLVFSPRGHLRATLEEGLVHPTGVAAFEERGEVLVSDAGDPARGVGARILVYDLGGQHRATIDAAALPREFRFSRPQGLAVDDLGRIFLVDSLLGQVLVFDRETLAGVATVGGYGSEPGELLLPLDAAFAGGDLLVTSNRAGRLEVFTGGLQP